MALSVQIHEAVHAIPFLRFYIIWVTITAAAVISVVRVVGHASPRASQSIKDVSIPYTWMTRSGWRGRVDRTGVAGPVSSVLCRANGNVRRLRLL